VSSWKLTKILTPSKYISHLAEYTHTQGLVSALLNFMETQRRARKGQFLICGNGKKEGEGGGGL